LDALDDANPGMASIVERMLIRLTLHGNSEPERILMTSSVIKLLIVLNLVLVSSIGLSMIGVNSAAVADSSPSGRLSPDEISGEITWYKNHADITLNSNGGTITTTDNHDKLMVFLDDDKYPVKSLTLTCKPKGIIGLASVQDTGRSPELYPVIYETTAPGSCILRSGAFAVTIVVKELAE
jgi:hypothetical protein